jgi:HPt (histidine-containing phosphotransfer) domain-containing protein
MEARWAMLRRVGGDKLIGGLIDLLLDSAPRWLAAARAALAVGDHDALGRAAHALKSAAGNLGAADVQKAADDLERRAAGEPGDEPAELLGRLEAAWARARDLLTEKKRFLSLVPGPSSLAKDKGQRTRDKGQGTNEDHCRH